MFLTAGPCTEAPAATVELWFYDDEADVRASDDPNTGQASGTPHTHPDDVPSAFFLRGVGVVVRDEPFEVAAYGALPALDQLDALARRRGKQDTTFTAVGYGLQRIDPVFVEASLDRMMATPRLIQINAPGFTGDFSLLPSINASTGGTCLGDSGGPNFLGDSTSSRASPRSGSTATAPTPAACSGWTAGGRWTSSAASWTERPRHRDRRPRPRILHRARRGPPHLEP